MEESLLLLWRAGEVCHLDVLLRGVHLLDGEVVEAVVVVVVSE